MTKVKEVFRSKGWPLACDQECLPTEGGIQDIVVDSEKCTLTIYHTSIVFQYRMNRDGSINEIAYW